MKSQRMFLGLSLLALILLAVVVSHVWLSPNLLYTTPETESAFLKNYTPKRVVEEFQMQLPSSTGQHSGASAGQESVTHQAGFDCHFAIRSEKWMPFMNALRDDASRQLTANGATLLSQNGDAREGFHFEYKLGKSLGKLTISPLTVTSPDLVHRGSPLPERVVDVTANIEQSEVWFPTEQGLMTVTVSSSIR